MAKVTEYPRITKMKDNDILLVDGPDGTRTILQTNASKQMGGEVIMINETAGDSTKVVINTTDEDIELATMADLEPVEEDVSELKTQLDNITNEKIYLLEQQAIYAKTVSGVGKVIATDAQNRNRAVVFPVETGKTYKIVAHGRANRNVVYGIAADTWGVDNNTVLTDLEYTPQISTAADDITVTISPVGYHFVMIIFSYTTQTDPYGYVYTVEATEKTDDEQFSVNGVKVPTYNQFNEVDRRVTASDFLVDYNYGTEENSVTYNGVAVTKQGMYVLLNGTDTSDSSVKVVLSGEFKVSKSIKASDVANSGKELPYRHLYRLRAHLISGTVTPPVNADLPTPTCRATSLSTAGNQDLITNGNDIYQSWYNVSDSGVTIVSLDYSAGTTFNNALYCVSMIDLDTIWSRLYSEFTESIAPVEDITAKASHDEGDLLMVNGQLCRVKSGGIAVGDTISKSGSGNVTVVTLADIIAENDIDLDEILKAVSDEYFWTTQINMVYRDEILPDTRLIVNTGETTETSGQSCTGFMPVEAGKTYSISVARVVCWYNESKTKIDGQEWSASSPGPRIVTAPSGAAFMRFGYGTEQTPMPMCNEGSELLPFDEKENRLAPKYYAGAKRYRLEMSTMSVQNGSFSETHHLSLLAAQRIDYTTGQAPRTFGYLLGDVQTGKLYSADANLENITELCTWDTSLSDNEGINYWMFNVMYNGDIVATRKRGRRYPIVYPHGDYNNPVAVEVSVTIPVWGGDYTKTISPIGPVQSPLAVCFEDGAYYFGEYIEHSTSAFEDHQPRCIWKVTYPYTEATNWTVVHAFNHANPASAQSTDPTNDIGHIHTIAYDWYNKDIYVTVGDYDPHCRIWRSHDFGETWIRCAEGAQIYRTVGVLFTEKEMWYCTDSGPRTHKVVRVPRVNNVPDFSNMEILGELEKPGQTSGQATGSNIMTVNPPGILCMDRGYHREDGVVQIPWYSFEDKTVYFIATLHALSDGSIPAASSGLCQDCYNLYQVPELDFQLVGGTNANSPANPNDIDALGNSASNPVGLIRMRIVPELSVT